MVRVIVGAAVAAVVMFIIGFIFFGPLGLSNLASRSLDDVPAATIQQTLAANLPASGTYFVPAPEHSAQQTVMYGQGPIATIHYNVGGFAAIDTTTMIVGLVFNFIVALLIGAALIGIDRRVTDFPSRAKVAVIIAVAAAAFIHLGEPIYYHHDWSHFIYLFVADALMLAAAGIVLAWFLPNHAGAAPADAPTEA